MRMKHEVHGFHNAYSLMEIEQMQKNGWAEDLPHKVVEQPIEALAVEETMATPAKFPKVHKRTRKEFA